MTELMRLEYESLRGQLDRMRAMQHSYNRMFYGLLLVSVVGAVGLILLGSITSLVCVCFGMITAAVTASFFLHYCDFARVQARALEGRMNRLIGRQVFIESQLEAEYFYPSESPKMSGFSFARPTHFFSVYTLHFLGVWGGLVLWAGAQLMPLLVPELRAILLVTWLVWTAVNTLYLFWWFALSKIEVQIARVLNEAYSEPNQKGESYQVEAEARK